MFAIPSIVNVPVVDMFFADGAVDLTRVGAVIGWFLIAALVGSALGILRQLGSSEIAPPSTTKVLPFHVTPPADVHHKRAA